MSCLSSSNLDDTIAEIFDDADELSVIQTLLHAIDADCGASASDSFAGRRRNSAAIQLGPCSCYTDYLVPHPRHPPSTFRSIFLIPLSLYKQLHNELVQRYAVFR